MKSVTKQIRQHIERTISGKCHDRIPSALWSIVKYELMKTTRDDDDGRDGWRGQLVNPIEVRVHEVCKHTT